VGRPGKEFRLPEAGPPPELRAEMDAAARVAQELRAQGRELRFEHDDVSGRIRVEVRDLDGNVLREIPASKALDIAAGAPLP
jgi:flagellar protein FlaG